MDDTALTGAIERLARFRAGRVDALVDRHSGLSVDDLDVILGLLHDASSMRAAAHTSLDDPAQRPASAEPLFNCASSLSDDHLAGEHAAMQDGVDDARKDALNVEITRRAANSGREQDE